MKRIQPELVPVLLAAFLAPLIGGHVSMDSQPTSAWLTAALSGSSEAPLGTRALIGTLLALAIAIVLLRRHVVQIPSLPLSGTLIGLVAITGLSVLGSAFTFVSLSAWPLWMVFAMATFAAVATTGRKAGPRYVLWAIVAGTTIAALKGVREFSELRALDPGHRIFADWNNPNAVAGIFCVVVPLALGLCLSSERLESLAAGLCGALMLFALALTQSKGGLLASALSVVVFASVALAWKAKGKLVMIALPLGIAGLLTFGSFAANRSQGSPAPFGRVVNASSTQEQSAGFRTLLWKSSIEMVKTKPTGYGVGTFRFESARPGLTEQTFHAHQTWLQLAAEASPLATLFLLGLAGIWVFHLFKGARAWPWPENGLRAGVLASCVAAAAHGMVETNLIYLGIGVVTFLVIGVGLQLSSDGILPEFTPKKVRYGLVLLCCLVPIAMLGYGASVESMKSRSLAAAMQGDVAGASSALQSAAALAPIDGEVRYLQSRLEPDDERRTRLLGQAASLNPSTRFLRAYARASADLNRKADTDRALERALLRDPNNLQTLEQRYLWLVAQGLLREGVGAARDLVAKEQTLVFQVRAIPELVPLETYDARVFLSGQTKDPVEREKLLRPALEGYVKYMDSTRPLVERQTMYNLEGSFLGHDRQEIEKVRVSGREVINELRKIYGASGDSASLSWLDSVASRFGD